MKIYPIRAESGKGLIVVILRLNEKAVGLAAVKTRREPSEGLFF